MTSISGNRSALTFNDQNFKATKTQNTTSGTGVVDAKKVGDGVLDLSDPTRLGEELQESTDSIKMVKVGDKYMSFTPEQVSAMVSQLKTLYEQKDVGLTMLVGFDAGQGLSVTSTSLNKTDFTDSAKLSDQTQKIIKEGTEYVSLAQRGTDQHSTVGHATAASRLDAQVKKLDTQVTAIQTKLDVLATQGITSGPEVDDLKAQQAILGQFKEVMTATADIHREMAKIPNLPDKPTGGDTLKELERLNGILNEKLDNLGTSVQENQGKIGNSDFGKNISHATQNAKGVNQHLTDAIGLARNPVVTSARQAYGSPVYLPGLVTQYEQYVKLVQNGDALNAKQPKPFPNLGYIDRPNCTADQGGYVEWCKAGVNDSKAFAQKFEAMGNKIDDFWEQPNLTPDQIKTKKAEFMAEMQKMFQNESGQYIIKEETAAKIMKVYSDQFDLGHCRHLVENNTAFVRDNSVSIASIDEFFEKENLTPTQIKEERHHLEESLKHATHLLEDFEAQGMTPEVINHFIEQTLAEFDEAHAAYDAHKKGIATIHANDEQLGTVVMANQQADKLNDNIGVSKITEFGNAANSVANTQNTENLQEVDATQTLVDKNLSDVNEIQQEQLHSTTHQMSNLGETLDHMAAGSKFEAYIGVGVQVGADIGIASAEIEAGAKLSFTAEKCFGQGPAYLLHFDFSAHIEANVELLGLFEASIGAEWETTLAGIGFRTSGEVQEYVDLWQDLLGKVTEGTEESMADAEKILDKIMALHDRNEYSSSATTVYGEVGVHVGHKEVSVGFANKTSHSEYPIYDKTNPPFYKSTEFVKADTKTYEFKVGHFGVEVIKESSQSYTDNTYTKMVKPGAFGDPTYTPAASRTVVEAKIPGHALLHMFHAGSMDAMDAILMASMIDSMKKENPHIAHKSDDDIKAMMGELFKTALTDAALVAKLTAISGAVLPDGGPVEAEFEATIGFEVDHKGNMGLEIGFDAKIEAKVDIPVVPGVEIYGEAGVQIKYAKAFHFPH